MAYLTSIPLRYAIITASILSIVIIGLGSWVRYNDVHRLEVDRARTEAAAARAESINYEQRRAYASAYAHVDSALAEGLDSLRAEVFRGRMERDRLRREMQQVNRALEAQANLLRSGGKK